MMHSIVDTISGMPISVVEGIPDNTDIVRADFIARIQEREKVHSYQIPALDGIARHYLDLEHYSAANRVKGLLEQFGGRPGRRAARYISYAVDVALAAS